MSGVYLVVLVGKAVFNLWPICQLNYFHVCSEIRLVEAGASLPFYIKDVWCSPHQTPSHGEKARSPHAVPCSHPTAVSIRWSPARTKHSKLSCGADRLQSQSTDLNQHTRWKKDCTATRTSDNLSRVHQLLLTEPHVQDGECSFPPPSLAKQPSHRGFGVGWCVEHHTCSFRRVDLLPHSKSLFILEKALYGT